MQFVFLSVALILSSASASPTPQIFGGNPPWNWIQTSFQQFQNAIPRPPFFQSGIWNQNRPGAQVQIPPNPAQTVAVQPVAPPQSNAQWTQTNEIPNRQVNGWFWQNWIPLPIITQYSPDQPTIVIISRPSKSPSEETTDSPTAISSESESNGISSSEQMSSSTSKPDSISNNTAAQENVTTKTQTSNVTTIQSSPVPLSTSGEN